MTAGDSSVGEHGRFSQAEHHSESWLSNYLYCKMSMSK